MFNHFSESEAAQKFKINCDSNGGGTVTGGGNGNGGGTGTGGGNDNGGGTGGGNGNGGGTGGNAYQYDIIYK